MSNFSQEKPSTARPAAWTRRVLIGTTGLGLIAGIGLTPIGRLVISKAVNITPSAVAYPAQFQKFFADPRASRTYVPPQYNPHYNGHGPVLQRFEVPTQVPVYGPVSYPVQPIPMQALPQRQPQRPLQRLQQRPVQMPVGLNNPAAGSVYVPAGHNPFLGGQGPALTRFAVPQNLPQHNGPVQHPHPYGAMPQAYGIAPQGSQSRSHFRMSVDGQHITGDGFEEGLGQVRADQALARANIQVRVDGLDVKPWLNVGTLNDSVHVPRGGPVQFLSYSNYDAYIAHSEVLVFAAPVEGSEALSKTTRPKDAETDKPLYVVPLDKYGRGQVFMAPQTPAKLIYQLRVYDREGRFDETKPKTLMLSNEPYQGPDSLGGLGAYGKDATQTRNIRVRGGAITVNGSHVPAGVSPHVFGRPVPTDADGQFVVQQILPFGKAPVHVHLTGPYGQDLTFHRNVDIKDTDLFYVALGDLTVGKSRAIGLADLTDASDDFDSVEIMGRGAFYLKGRIKGETLITASLDTGEASIDDLLSNLDDKDPRQLLRRLDSDAYYPVYGDDSTTREDAPTQGRFYVRLEKDDSTLMWGNFATAVTGTEIAQLDRGLYGGLANYKSLDTTRFGERRGQATVFAADPGTLAGRDEFRGTGGSLYYIQRQDIAVGSERLRIEVRDKLTGLVLETRDLTAYEDYTVDYLQGRILLNEPLQSTVSDNQVVRTGGLSGHEAYLVARYEYTPGVADISGFTVGGRASQWFGDHLRVGTTMQREKTGTADQTVLAADVLLRASETSYLKGEFGVSEGPGFDEARSSDGGFIFDSVNAPGVRGEKAEAYRVEGQLDLTDMARGPRPYTAKIKGTYEHQEAGYSGQGRIGYGEVTRAEAGFDGSLGDSTRVSLQYDELSSEERGKRKSFYADLTQKITNSFAIAAGIRRSDQDPSTINNLSADSPRGIGARTDATAELRFEPSDELSVRAFYQDTLERDAGRASANRYGAGADVRLNQHMRLSGEVSEGDGGLGASAQLNYQNPEGAEYYIGYALSTDDQDDLSTVPRESYSSYGTITAGARRRYNDALSIYGEEKLSFGQTGQNLTHAYGVDFRPNALWAFGVSAEVGNIQDDINGDFDREAFAFSSAFTGEALRIATNVEARFERGVLNAQNRDRNSYFLRNTLAYKAGRDFELLGRFNLATSESDQSSILDADFIEGVVGVAYRPVFHDRFNALAKYTFFEDLSPADQGLNDAGNRSQITARQRSHIASLDGTYDLTNRLSLGAKLAYRLGEVETVRGSNEFYDSEAGLAILRADLHIMNEWDAFMEGRYLTASLANDARTGSLFGLHRHIGDKMKIGGGYSFSTFSDDLTDFENDSDGWFINLVGKL